MQVNSDSMVLNLQARGEAGYSFVADYRRAADSNAMSWEIIMMFPVRIPNCMTATNQLEFTAFLMHAHVASLEGLLTRRVNVSGQWTENEAAALQVGMVVSTILFCGGFLAIKGLRNRRRDQALIAEAMQREPSAPGRVPSDIIRGVTGMLAFPPLSFTLCNQAEEISGTKHTYIPTGYTLL